MEKTKFFVNRTLQSDTVGNLDLSVRLAQSSIILGKNNQVAGDVQPHLVAQRDTLMLCKPLNNSVAKGDSIEVLVYDKDNRLTYSSKDVSASNVPEIIGNITSNIDMTETDFAEPASYNYTISKQAEFNKMKDDKTGAYLSNLLKQYNSIKIVTSDGLGI